MYNFEGNKPMSQVLYINGVKRNVTPLGGATASTQIAMAHRWFTVHNTELVRLP
jgi:hypothetical protein